MPPAVFTTGKQAPFVPQGLLLQLEKRVKFNAVRDFLFYFYSIQ